MKHGRTVCRPSCSARTCTPTNVLLFDTLEDALEKGYRPCTRCHPELERWEGTKKELARAAERLIRQRYMEKFSLEALAGELHAEKSYLARTFKAVTGCTLLEYHNRVRCEAARELLTNPGIPVSFIATEVGYVSASHFTQVFRKLYGVTPTRYREAYLTSLDE